MEQSKENEWQLSNSNTPKNAYQPNIGRVQKQRKSMALCRIPSPKCRKQLFKSQNYLTYFC